MSPEDDKLVETVRADGPAMMSKVGGADAEKVEPPQPPAAPPRRDPELEQLKAGLTEAEQQHHKKSHAAPVLISLDEVEDDAAFRLRDVGELARLATDIARLGQLYPIDLRPRGERFQVVAGFRRVAALRFLQRDRVLARVHAELSDDDALLMALAAAIDTEPASAEELQAAKERLESEGRLSPAAQDMLEKALAHDEGLAPEGVEEEVDADELAEDVTVRLGEINQDLALLADVFSQLDAERKEELLKQLSYSAELVAYLEGR